MSPNLLTLHPPPLLLLRDLTERGKHEEETNREGREKERERVEEGKRKRKTGSILIAF